MSIHIKNIFNDISINNDTTVNDTTVNDTILLKYTIKHTKNIFDNNDIVVVVFTVTKKPVLDLSDTTNGNVLLDKIYVSPITNA